MSLSLELQGSDALASVSTLLKPSASAASAWPSLTMPPAFLLLEATLACSRLCYLLPPLYRLLSSAVCQDCLDLASRCHVPRIPLVPSTLLTLLLGRPQQSLRQGDPGFSHCPTFPKHLTPTVFMFFFSFSSLTLMFLYKPVMTKVHQAANQRNTVVTH